MGLGSWLTEKKQANKAYREAYRQAYRQAYVSEKAKTREQMLEKAKRAGEAKAKRMSQFKASPAKYAVKKAKYNLQRYNNFMQSPKMKTARKRNQDVMDYLLK